MIEVEAVAKFDANREDVARVLTPERIMECEQTYAVVEVSETSPGWTVRALPYGDDREVVAAFTSIPDGYEYEMSSGGYFEDISTTVTIHDEGTRVVDDPAAGEDGVFVVMRSEFTFGGVLAPFIDRFASDKRKEELRRALLKMDELLDEQSGNA